MANHSSILARKIPWTEEPGGLVHGVARVRNDWETKQTNSFSFCQYEQLTPVMNFLESIFPQNTNVFYCLFPYLFCTDILGFFHRMQTIIFMFSDRWCNGALPEGIEDWAPPPRGLTRTIFTSDPSSSCSCDIFIWRGKWAFWNLGAVTHSLQRQPVAPR